MLLWVYFGFFFFTLAWKGKACMICLILYYLMSLRLYPFICMCPFNILKCIFHLRHMLSFVMVFCLYWCISLIHHGKVVRNHIYYIGNWCHIWFNLFFHNCRWVWLLSVKIFTWWFFYFLHFIAFNFLLLALSYSTDGCNIYFYYSFRSCYVWIYAIL